MQVGLAFLRNLRVVLDMDNPQDLYELPHLGVDEQYPYDVMDHVAWRRSALEFLPDLVARGTEASKHAALLEDLAHQVQTFDAALLELFKPDLEGWPDDVPPPHEAPKPPEGLPKSHWWWWYFEGILPKVHVF